MHDTPKKQKTAREKSVLLLDGLVFIVIPIIRTARGVTAEELHHVVLVKIQLAVVLPGFVIGIIV